MVDRIREFDDESSLLKKAQARAVCLLVIYNVCPCAFHLANLCLQEQQTARRRAITLPCPFNSDLVRVFHFPSMLVFKFLGLDLILAQRDYCPRKRLWRNGLRHRTRSVEVSTALDEQNVRFDHHVYKSLVSIRLLPISLLDMKWDFL